MNQTGGVGSSTRRGILDLAVQIPTVFPSIVFDVGSSVVNPVTSVVDPVRTGRVETPEVTVHPRQGSDSDEPEPAHGEEPSCEEEEEGASWDPYWARDDDQRREEYECENGSCDG